MEDKFGKEDAHIIFDALETSIKSTIQDSNDKLKYTVIEELKKELASKSDIALVKKEIDVVRKEIDVVKKEIELVETRLRKEMRIQFIILIALIILLNQNSLEMLGIILGIIK